MAFQGDKVRRGRSAAVQGPELMVAMMGGDCIEKRFSFHKVSLRMIDDAHKMDIWGCS